MKEYFTSIEPWERLLDNDVSQAYLMGIGTALLVILVFLILRILFALLFRTRRCREIIIPAGDGDVMVAYSAVESAIKAVLTDFPALELREAKLYRQGKRYSLYLVCSFDASGNESFPEEIKAVKKAVFESLKKLFAIENVRRIKIRLEKFSSAPEIRKQEEKAALFSNSYPETSGAGADALDSGL